MPKGVYARVPLAQRFWSRVDKSAGPHGCWPWQGARGKHGRGIISVNGQLEIASRVAFFLQHGHYPEQFAMHQCEHVWCCNPAHLYDGRPQKHYVEPAR